MEGSMRGLVSLFLLVLGHKPQLHLLELLVLCHKFPLLVSLFSLCVVDLDFLCPPL